MVNQLKKIKKTLNNVEVTLEDAINRVAFDNDFLSRDEDHISADLRQTLDEVRERLTEIGGITPDPEDEQEADESQFGMFKVTRLSDIKPEPILTRIGCAEFVKENLTIRLHGYGYTGKGFYEVDMERDTLEIWLDHLRQKSWVTSEMLGDLAQVWLSHQHLV